MMLVLIFHKNMLIRLSTTGKAKMLLANKEINYEENYHLTDFPKDFNR